MNRHSKKMYLAEYRSWQGMKVRCINPKDKAYRYYGGRGIKVCENWVHSFDQFMDDMGPRPSPEHSLDRIDPNGNYEPSNCRWADRSTQAANRRNVHRLKVGGEVLTVAEASRRSGVNEATIRFRVYRGLSQEQATRPGRVPYRRDSKFATGLVDGREQTRSIPEWAAAHGMPAAKLAARLGRGVPLQLALSPERLRRVDGRWTTARAPEPEAVLPGGASAADKLVELGAVGAIIDEMRAMRPDCRGAR